MGRCEADGPEELEIERWLIEVKMLVWTILSQNTIILKSQNQGENL